MKFSSVLRDNFMITRSPFAFSPAAGKTFDTEEIRMKTLLKLFFLNNYIFSSVCVLLSEQTFNIYLIKLD